MSNPYFLNTPIPGSQIAVAMNIIALKLHPIAQIPSVSQSQIIAPWTLRNRELTVAIFNRQQKIQAS